MIELKTKIRKWGNSFGVVIPLNKVKNIGEGEEVRVFISKKSSNVLKKMFGSHKFKKSVKQMMDEIDEELYDE